MFDISWSEFLLIGVVALIVIGPKELPTVMRTMGQWTRKVRSMAADFQNQFHEAMREAEMADLKKQVDDIAQDIKNYDPLKDVRADVEAIGKDLNSDLNKDLNANLGTDLSKDAGKDSVSPATIAPVEERPLLQAAAELERRAATAPAASERAAEKASPDSVGHAE